MKLFNRSKEPNAEELRAVMEALKVDGGPVSPIRLNLTDGNYQTFGLSTRDWFAGMVLQGLLAGRDPDENLPIKRDVAEWSYACADAMLAERAKGSDKKE